MDVFSDMHVEQGCRIMGHWDIPLVYESVVANHHADDFDPQDTLLAIVRLVNFHSMHCDLDLYPQSIQPIDVAAEIAALNVSEAALTKLEADMRKSFG